MYWLGVHNAHYTVIRVIHYHPHFGGVVARVHKRDKPYGYAMHVSVVLRVRCTVEVDIELPYQLMRHVALAVAVAARRDLCSLLCLLAEQPFYRTVRIRLGMGRASVFLRLVANSGLA